MNKLDKVNEIEQQMKKLRIEHRQAITEYLKSIGMDVGTVFKMSDKFGNIYECKIVESNQYGNFIYKINKDYGNINTFNYEKLKQIV